LISTRQNENHDEGKRLLKPEVKVARGEWIGNLTDALDLVKETGYPLVAKTEMWGWVAASPTRSRLKRVGAFLHSRSHLLIICSEEFIQGDIQTFDGLDRYRRQAVFLNSLVYSAGVMETVLANDIFINYTLRVDSS
jgi:hypothetical protein